MNACPDPFWMVFAADLSCMILGAAIAVYFLNKNERDDE